MVLPKNQGGNLPTSSTRISKNGGGLSGALLSSGNNPSTTPGGKHRKRGNNKSSSPSLYTTFLQAFVLLIVVYVASILVWSNSQLNSGNNVKDIIASTKDAFITNTRRSMDSVNAAGIIDTSWLFGSDEEDDNRAPLVVRVDDDDTVDVGAVIPIELTVNFLKPIDRAPGAPPEPPLASEASKARTSEDFLPVVVPSEVTFRWGHVARAGSLASEAAQITAYRMIVREAATKGKVGSTVWDTARVGISEETPMPGSLEWGGPKPLQAGQILEWSVQTWDASDRASASAWSKFAVGPPDGEIHWKGVWIAHPHDMDTFNRKKATKGDPHDCGLWKQRRPLPLFRTIISPDELEEGSEEDPISSALLVISGLGSFRASFDGVPLSTSGPIDPPFTDYSKRVSYRGFDVTPFLSGGDDASHVIGVTLGSGWWDHRPVTGMAKPKLLPRGPATVIAQVIVTYASGKARVVGATGGGDSPNKWQVSRGHIRESDLFTGEMVDLSVLGEMEGWDTMTEWNAPVATDTDGSNPYEDINKWIRPVAYHTEVTGEERKQELALRAKAMTRSDPAMKSFPRRENIAAPIGRLVPNEIPPVMAMERIAPEEIFDLGSGRWLIDYGKAFSGMLHFDEGVPTPMTLEEDKYPRAHGFKAATKQGDSFVTVIYGESLEMTTGDINRVLTAGLGQHDGGPRHVSKKEGHTNGAYCFPDDHDNVLSQKDVYVIPKASAEKGNELFAKARQSHFTTHAFRFAEVCCTREPPKNAHGLLYRTAVTEWGTFDSSNVNINGGYELVKNAMASNMLSVQSDCPHREKLPYGGDLVADSPAAMHMYDMSAFYKKTVQDWLDAQWDNGAYTETSIWQDLNDYAGIGNGAGETVWATAPPVLTVRHMQHYGDMSMLKNSLDNHVRWIDFLDKHFEAGMLEKGYDEELEKYTGQKSGLGDWLAMRSRDTWLTHTGFYMAAGRCVAYIAHQVGMKDLEEKGMAVAKKIQDRIVRLYLKNGKDDFDYPRGSASQTPGPEMSLFSKIVPGEKRCVVLKNWFRRSGHTWPGDEERRFLAETSDEDKAAMTETGELSKRGKELSMGWSQWQGMNEGIFAIRYAMKTLSDMGFHNIALRKAAGFGFATAEYMMRHNATTMWESWWRSEDLYSRNHPMLGAVAEWMASSAAGVSHYPTTTGGRKMLFWPRFPNSATTLRYASATQGTINGNYSIAWTFEDLPTDKSEYNSATVKVRVRFLVPPGGEAVVRPPIFTSSKTTATLRQAKIIPDLPYAKKTAWGECKIRRNDRKGFPYSWEYDRSKEQWHRYESGKAIGTPCKDFLFHHSLGYTKWDTERDITDTFSKRIDVPIGPGLHEIVFTNWQLEKEVEGTGRIGNLPEYYNADNLGPYCEDSRTFEWDIDDGTHII